MVVYFIEDKQNKTIKIGYSENHKRRYYCLKSITKSDLIITLVIPGNRNLESAIHKAFRKYHIGHEWFKTNEELLNFINKVSNGEQIENILKEKGIEIQLDSEIKYKVLVSLTNERYNYLKNKAEANYMTISELLAYTLGEAQDKGLI